MVDVKISALSAISAVAAEDLIAIIDDPSGTPASRKATFTQILAFIDANSAGLNNVVEDTTPQLGADLECQGSNIQEAGVIFLKEQADADADVAGEGQIWVNTATPNELYFTDDAGTDFRLNFNTSAQLLAMLSDETGSGALVFATSPTLVTPALGTPASGNLESCTAYPGDSSLVTVGTVATGTWNGDVVASVYLDSDTAHLGVAQTFSAAKTFSADPVFQDNVKASFGTGSDSTIVDTGSGMFIDFDEQNAGSKSLTIESDGNEVLLFGGVGSAVNHFQITNSTTGNDPILEAVGDDTNIGITLTPKGTGSIYGNREVSSYPLTDEETAPSTGVKYTSEPAPYDMKIEDVIAGLTTAGTGATLFTFDILKENSVNANAFTTIFSTKPTIDASEFTSTTAAAAMVLSVTTLEKGRRLQLKIDTLDTNALGRGAKITLITHATAK